MKRIWWGIAFVLLSVMTGVVAAQEVTYTVQRGDTLQRIADRYDVDLDALLIRNNIIDPNRIRAGQTLIIPTGAVSFPRRHIVQPGENLRFIAQRYNTTVEALQRANNISNPNNIVVGQVLTLPAAGGPASFPRSYQLDIGDTLRSVAAEFGTTWQALAAYNNIPNPNYVQAGMVITIPPAGYTPPATGGPIVQPRPRPQPRTYVVQQGDVLELIAARFNTTAAAIRQRNNITNSRAIFPGDVLIIPATGGPVTPPHRYRRIVNGRYTVQAGDTLFRIAASFGVNLYDLAEVNGILNLNSIFAGQSLIIPRG